ncbi:MAG: ribonuclease HI [Clostridia bacterium]|nr:ribonuclease HI [Clostridia bacterium]
MSKLTKVDMFTDGACSGNPGPGGWGTILRAGTHEKEFSGADPETTNNKMELTAVIEGFKALKRPCSVTLYTDSKYVADALEQGWAKSWKENGWRKADRKPAQNIELWDELLTLIEPHELKIIWLKGHAGHPENERCDKLAVKAYQPYLIPSSDEEE